MTVDDLMAVLWDAHTSSIKHAMDIFVDELSYLPDEQEQKFGIGWGNFVEVCLFFFFLFSFAFLFLIWVEFEENAKN
jgi:hypothetical protein